MAMETISAALDDLELHNSIPAEAGVDDCSKPTLRSVSTARDMVDSPKGIIYRELLKERHIRLLHLHAGSGEDPILCSLFQSPLKNLFPFDEAACPSFEAVSYSWGSESTQHLISCNWIVPSTDENGAGYVYSDKITNNLEVTENLFRFLLRARLPNVMRTLWIDQICIDQSNEPDKLEEKMSQIRMMGEIYGAAKDVLIWLGEEDFHTSSAFGMMNWLAETRCIPNSMVLEVMEYLSSEEEFLDGDKFPAWGEWAKHLKSLLVHIQPQIITDVDNPDFQYGQRIVLLESTTLATLLERSWFQRTWTFQEVVAATSVTIMCGSHKAPWESLYEACKSLQTHRIVGTRLNDRHKTASIIGSIIRRGDLQLDSAKSIRLATGNSITLEDIEWYHSGAFQKQRKIKYLLPLVRSTLCRDPQDKVLSILGISHDDHRRIEFPNANWPVVNLYTSIVSYWVWGLKKMDIHFLNHVQESNPGHELPSWVPDWSMPSISAPLIDLAEFSASGNTSPIVEMDKLDYFSELEKFPYFPPLGVEGFLIFKVLDVEADLDNHQRHAEMLNQFGHVYPTTQLSYLEAYRRIMNPKIPEDYQASEEDSTFRRYTNELEAKRLATITSVESSTILTTLYSATDIQNQLPTESPFIGTFSTPVHQGRTASPGRAFFVSTTGFIGLCPKNTLPGDQVFIFLGGATPFIIRVVHDGIVRFLGECYVLGAMHGEAMVGRPRKRTMLHMR